MSDQPPEFHTREQLATALNIQREVTEEQSAAMKQQAECIAILEARLARTNDFVTVTLRAEILAWLLREQREIVYQFTDTDFTTMERACEATGDDPTRKVAAWIVGILNSDFIFSERALRGVLRQRCSVCGDGCTDDSTALQIPVVVSRLIADVRARAPKIAAPAEKQPIRASATTSEVFCG